MTGSRFLPVPLVVAAGFLLAMPISAAETLLVDEGGTLSTRAAAVAAIGAEGQSPHAEAPPFRELMRRYPPESLAEALAEGIVLAIPICRVRALAQ